MVNVLGMKINEDSPVVDNAGSRSPTVSSTSPVVTPRAGKSPTRKRASSKGKQSASTANGTVVNEISITESDVPKTPTTRSQSRRRNGAATPK